MPLTVDRTLIAAIRSFCVGPSGIALGGSLAKNAGDAHSDIDLYVFSNAIKPDAERTALIRPLADADRDCFSWSDAIGNSGTDFYHRGRKHEIWLRRTEDVSRTIADCAAGKITRTYSNWAVMGFYNYCALADLRDMKPLHDEDGVLQTLQQSVRAYPPRLKSAIVELHLQDVNLWPDNEHYLSAIQREDVLYTTGIVLKVVHGLVQLLFAANETFFPGEKRLAATIRTLPRKPANADTRLIQLINPPHPLNLPALEAQRHELKALITETRALL